MCTDTGSNESHHKLTKVAANLTQKDSRVFEGQTAQRIVEFLILDFGLAELEGKTIWEYFVVDQDCSDDDDSLLFEQNHEDMDVDSLQDVDCEEQVLAKTVHQPIISTGGTRIKVYRDEDNEAMWQFTGSKMKKQCDVSWDSGVVEYLVKVQEELRPFITSLDVCTEHKRDSQIFRGHPNYRKKGIWNDWAMVNWGKDGKNPAEIWCFLDLTMLPEDAQVVIDSVRVRSGVYALIESATYIAQEDQVSAGKHASEIGTSQLFLPMLKDCAESADDDGEIIERMFYLADVDALLDPIVVVPDVGEDVKRKYFHVVSRELWSKQFTDWVELPYEDESKRSKRPKTEE